MIVETCPVCGHDLEQMILVPKKYCPYCGWDWPGEYEINIEESYFDPVLSNQTTFNVPRYCEPAFVNSPCRTCPNNPANGGSGICFCILGQPKFTY